MSIDAAHPHSFLLCPLRCDEMLTLLSRVTGLSIASIEGDAVHVQLQQHIEVQGASGMSV